MSTEHPFAGYVRTLGKGKNGGRSLTQEEARHAMGLILDGQAEPEQIGAFLMLLRVKEEVPEEVAGFAAAVRAALPRPEALPAVDVDWSSYAGKRRQLPWYLLAALLLTENGLTVFMHGMSRDDERVYAPEALTALGIRPVSSLAEAAAALKERRFAYLPIEQLSPRLHQFIVLRNLLGLRSPAHTIARMINPFDAPLQVQGIFHPGYAPIHQRASHLLHQPQAVVFKGEGGEAERDPDKPVTVFGVDGGLLYEEEWPPLFDSATRHMKVESLDLAHLRAVWEGDAEDEYGEAAVVGSCAILLKASGRAAGQAEALAMARRWWSERSRRLAA